jgi:hypothetical protein
MNFLYINNLTTVKNSLKNYDNNVKMVFNNYEKKVIDKNSILFYDKTNSNKCLYEDKNKIGYVLGYIRFLGTKSKKILDIIICIVERRSLKNTGP